MKIVKVEKTGKDSLYTTFLVMTLVPLLLFGVIAAGFVSYRVRETVKAQVNENLSNIAATVVAAYDEMYPGEYSVLIMKKSATMYKGDEVLSENTAFIDKVKQESGMEISLFFADTRLVTTLEGQDGKRLTNLLAAEKVVAEVFLEKNEKFYDNVYIEKTPYYAYYRPIFSENDMTCIGMVGVAIPSEHVNRTVMNSIFLIIGILLVFMIVTAYFIVKSTSKIVDIINRILEFLRELTKDNLDAKIDELVIHRKDELGEIGIASTKLQMSLKKLIERDALTGLYNRRAAERKLKGLDKNGIKFSISIGDIDFFKKFNDNFGHECGDVVLKEVSACLNEGMRGKGFVARWGGEEFLLVFEEIEDISAGLFLNDILQSVRDRVIEYDGQNHSVTMTFGVVGRLEDESVSDQIRRADDKLYEGKQGGRNRVVM